MPEHKDKKAPGDKRQKSDRKPSSDRSSRSRSRRAKSAGDKDGGSKRTTYARMNILQSAAEVFGNLGYTKTRVEDIISAADISRPTFYRFFRSKEDVFDAVDEISHVSLLQLVRGAVSTVEDPIQKMERSIDAFLRWHAATGPVAKVLRQEALQVESEFARRRAATIQMILELFEQEAAAAKREDIDPLIFTSLIAALEHIADRLHEESESINETDMERAKAVALRLLYGALARKGDPIPPLPRLSKLSRKNRRDIQKRRKEASKRKEQAAPKANLIWAFNPDDD